jgi:23S rRNA (uracil1939-C5)-methyltransferase
MKRGSLILNVPVHDMAAEGKALVRHEGMIVFVEGAVPGDVADIEITGTKKDYAVGRIVRLESKSPARNEPFCKHFGTCGGCKWQHISYEKQLEFKQLVAEDAFRRIGKIHEPMMERIIGCDNPIRYRNKLEFTFTDVRWFMPEEISSGHELDRRGLGFHVPGAFDRVLNIEACWLMDDYVNEIRNTAGTIARKQSIPFFNLRSQQGILRNLVVRNTTRGEWLVLVVFAKDDSSIRDAYVDELVTTLPGVDSWHSAINPKGNDSIHDLKVTHIDGAPFITEQLDELTFRIGPKSFFQTNTGQALNLYRMVREWAGLAGDERILDLYCGTGTIGLFLSKQCKEVLGIEVIAEAIQDAEANAAANRISNARFVCSNLDDTTLSEIFPSPDLIVVDPPRAGLHPRVTEQVNASGARRVIYVSCNPATQARDIARLSAYRLSRTRPLDMFPQTPHVENVAMLEMI